MAQKVLVVDDSREIRNIIRYLLVNQGFEVVGEAADGVEALAQWQTLQPDIITLDLNMPHMNGLEMMQRLRQGNSQSKIVVISGEDEIATLPENCNVVQWLRKPFNLVEFIRAFKEIGAKCS